MDMFEKIESWLTFGNQYVAASLIYLGLAILLGGSTLLDHPRALASGGSDCTYYEMELIEDEWVQIIKPGCEPWLQCCGGHCVPLHYICCEDGTYGPADECVCCEGCVTDPNGNACLGHASTVDCY